jgi:Tfp pilus assembly ATPase PilU
MSRVLRRRLDPNLVKLDPIKKIPELMGSPLPTAIEFSRNGPTAFALTVWASSRLLALAYINQNQIGLFLYHLKFKIFACFPSTSQKRNRQLFIRKRGIW